jgi:prophage tail gpP-like protein
MIFETQNVKYEGFISANVSTSIDSLSDTFTIHANNRWASGGLRAGDECAIYDYNDEKLLEGYIDAVEPHTDGRIQISGRNKAGDLIDSTAAGSGEFTNLTLLEIVQRLCEPFGIIATGEDGSRIDRFRYAPDETVSQIIKRLAVRQGFLIYSDPSGDVIIANAGNTRAPIVLEQGVNIISGSAKIDARRLHSLYKVLGQNYDSNTVNGEFAGLATRYRPLTQIDGGNIQIRDALTGAEWVANVSDGMAATYTIILSGLVNVRPNTLIDTKSESLGVEGDLFINRVTWQLAKETQTVLNLVNPYAFGLDSVGNRYLA